MTFDEYVANPMGRSNAVMSAAARESQRNIYKHKFDNILLRENGKIDYYLYKADGDVYFIHIKIPSEVVDNFYYDVVLKFTGNASLASSTTGLDKYQVQFYSNDPAFVYTYAYVFRKNNLLVTELEPRMAKKAMRQAPSERNPSEEVGYVKSLYFAYLFMKNRGLFSKIKFTGAEKFNRRTLLSNVENAETKVQKRQELGEEARKKKRSTISKSTYSKLKASGVSDDTLSNNVRVATTKRVGVVRNKALNSKSNTRKTKSTKKF